MKTPSSLFDFRLDAAIQSRGISEDHIIEKIGVIIAKLNLTGDILDFGAGVGNLTKKLLQTRKFSNIFGVDILPRPEDLPKSVQWLSADLNIATPFHDNKFDCIISPEVIEHLENPRSIAREWSRLLKDSGVLIFSTPNNHSWRSIFHYILKGHFVAFADSSYPAHITALTEIDMKRIMLEVGFNQVEFYYTDNGGIPKLPNITWQQISLGLLKGKMFSDNIICVAKK